MYVTNMDLNQLSEYPCVEIQKSTCTLEYLQFSYIFREIRKHVVDEGVARKKYS